MYVFMMLTNKIIIILWCMYVYMYLCYRLIGWSWIILVEEWLFRWENDMKRFLIYEESSGKSTHVKHMRSVSCEYEFILYACICPCLCYGQVIPRNTSAKWKQCGLRHAKKSMDKTLEARLLGRGRVVLDVWYYCFAYVIHVVHVTSGMIVHMY